MLTLRNMNITVLLLKSFTWDHRILLKFRIPLQDVAQKRSLKLFDSILDSIGLIAMKSYQKEVQ